MWEYTHTEKGRYKKREKLENMTLPFSTKPRRVTVVKARKGERY